MDGKGSEMEDVLKKLTALEVERDYYRQVAERLGQKTLADAQDFSQMIRDLRQREIKLQASREALEKTIEERTAELVTRNKELSESILRYDRLVKRIPHGVYTFRVKSDGERHFGYVSPPFCQILDIDSEEVQRNASLAFSIVYPDDREGLEIAVREANEHRIPFRWEGRFIVRQEIRWIRLEADPTQTPAGDIVWNGVLCDITESRLIQDKLQESEERLNFLVNNSSDALVIINADGSLRFASSAAERITGFGVAELEDKTIDTLFHPDDVEAVKAAWSEAVKHPEKTVTVQYRHIHKTRGWVFSEAIAQSFLAEPGTNGVIASVRNITEHKRTERFLKDVITKNPMSIQILDTDGCTLEVNPSYKSLFGSVPPDGYSIFSDPQLLQMGMGKIFDQLRNGSIVRFPDTYFNAHDSISEFPDVPAWIRTLGFPINGNDEKPERFVLMHENITERKQAEEALQESEEKFRQIINTVREGIVSLDSEWRIAFANAHLAEMLGYEIDELLGQSFDFLLPTEDLENHERHKHEREQGQYSQFERRFKTKDGHEIWTIVSASALLDNEGRFAGSFSTITDITKRKEAEEALRESEETFRNIVQATPMGIHLYHLQNDGRLVFVGTNPAADTLLGVDNTRFIGMTIEEAFPPLQNTDIPVRYRRAAQLGESWHTEQIDYDHDKIAGAFEVHAFQMSLGKVAVLFNDITERKLAEEERQRLQRQLTQAQKMEAIGQLAGGVAHDFNNMLGVIIGYSELILEKANPSQQFRAELEEIQKAARRSADLTRQLLTFARKQTVAPKMLDLNQTVEGMLNMLRRLIGENIKLVWMPGNGLRLVKMDPSQIDQILANLCVNARDAITGVGKITVATDNVIFTEEYCAAHAGSLPGEYVQITVSDSGKGMDKETLAHIFEPFFTTKGVGEGTGLGLATVYGAVKQNHGYINATSELGQGTTFTICIPRYVDKALPSTRTAAEDSLPSGSETILLVEDEPMILKMTTLMLIGQGYRVLAAALPWEAIHLAKENAGSIDLLMTDVIMPEMNGCDLAKHLLTISPNIKRLFMSGYTANIIEPHGVLEKGVHFIQKPFSMKDLTATIRKALEN